MRRDVVERHGLVSELHSFDVVQGVGSIDGRADRIATVVVPGYSRVGVGRVINSGVVSSAAIQHVVACAAIQGVVATKPVETIIACIPGQGIIACIAGDRVIACAASGVFNDRAISHHHLARRIYGGALDANIAPVSLNKGKGDRRRQIGCVQRVDAAAIGDEIRRVFAEIIGIIASINGWDGTIAIEQGVEIRRRRGHVGSVGDRERVIGGRLKSVSKSDVLRGQRMDIYGKRDRLAAKGQCGEWGQACLSAPTRANGERGGRHREIFEI